MSRLDPHSYADLQQGRITAMDLDLSVDFDARSVRGTATASLAEPAGGPLDLDTRDLKIERVFAADGKDLPWRLAEADPILGSRLTVDLPPGARSFGVAFATSPQASALQWLQPAETDGGRHPYLFSQCQAIHARSVIPCQDSPLARFTFTARLTVPQALTAVMAAAPGRAEAGPRPGTRTFSFAMPQSIPPYLFAFAVGDLAAQDLGPRSRVYSEPVTLPKAAWEFAGVNAMLEAAEEVFGPYLWDRFDFLVMPASFPYGGMENPRLTFLTPTLLAGDRSLVNVLAHELAHSWTGNLVTNATIDHFWLNEGFTVWAERRILEKLYGPEAMAMAATLGRNGLLEAIEHFGADSPFTRLQTESEGKDPDEFYSLVPYEKGYLLVTLLEQAVGRPKFDAFIKDYIAHFRFTSITTDQFLQFLEQRLPGAALQVRARQWIHEPGLPDNAPVFTSARLQDMTAQARAWTQGGRPDVAAAKAWRPDEWLIFLQGLPRRLPAEDCRWLDENFGLTDQGNSEVLSNWLVIAAGSGYEPALPRIRAFLGQVGRMKYLKPLYTALHRNEATRAVAAEIFAASAAGYHPIARGGIQRILAG